MQAEYDTVLHGLPHLLGVARKAVGGKAWEQKMESKEVRAGVLALLQGSARPNAVVTVVGATHFLEEFRFVKDPHGLWGLRLLRDWVPPTAPLTPRGLVSLLYQLAEINPAATRDHVDAMARNREKLAALPDRPMLAPEFFDLCQKILLHPPAPSHPAAQREPARPAGRGQEAGAQTKPS
jgi:hypothetical protein